MGNIDSHIGLVRDFCCSRPDSELPLQQQDIEYTSNKIALTQACQAIRLSTQSRCQAIGNRIFSFDIENLAQKQIKLCYLNLRVISSPSLEKGEILSINPLGYENSARDSKDGMTYFGNCKRQMFQQGEKGEVINDVILPRGKQKIPGRHFVIDYQWASNSYYIKDLGLGMGVFRKIHSPLYLKANTMISLNGNFVVFDIIKHSDFTELACSLYSKDINGEVLSFYSNQFDHREIRIGRGSNCEIFLRDISVSKVQTTVVWRSGHWMLMDGDANAKIYSRNGTWVYLNQRYRLLNGMIIKTGEHVYLVKLYNKS